MVAPDVATVVEYRIDLGRFGGALVVTGAAPGSESVPHRVRGTAGVATCGS